MLCRFARHFEFEGRFLHFVFVVRVVIAAELGFSGGHDAVGRLLSSQTNTG